MELFSIKNINFKDWLYNSQTYNPLYDSPIEDLFAYHIDKYLSEETKLTPQYPIKTFCSNYRLDFCLELENKTIGIECDGEKYHNKKKTSSEMH